MYKRSASEKQQYVSSETVTSGGNCTSSSVRACWWADLDLEAWSSTRDVIWSMNARQLLVLHEWEHLYKVESCDTPQCENHWVRGVACRSSTGKHRRWWGVMEVDGSTPSWKSWKPWRHCHRRTGMPVQPTGSFWNWGSLPSKDWNVPLTCKLPDCREVRHHGCSRNIICQRDRLESRKGEDLLCADDILRYYCISPWLCVKRLEGYIS